MIGGLKSYLPRLAEIVGSTPAALYERQRALTRLGLLIAQEGRGPGSGVALSADSLAVMIISLLVTENLSDINKRVALLCNARPLRDRKNRTSVTGAKTFRQAVATLLTDPRFSRKEGREIVIAVSKHGGTAHIFQPSDLSLSTLFEIGAENPKQSPVIRRESRAGPELLHPIADDLASRGIGP
jgi:hypothetical protein